jgi:hypothetical protein
MEITILATVALGVAAKYLEHKLQRNVQEENKQRMIEQLKEQYA